MKNTAYGTAYVVLAATLSVFVVLAATAATARRALRRRRGIQSQPGK